MTIHYVKDDPLLQDLIQEPSTSSKYGLQGQGVLDVHLIMIQSSNLAHKQKISYLESSTPGFGGAMSQGFDSVK